MNLNDLDESLRSDNPCWKGYKPVGTKNKDGRTVPNCVPESNQGVAEGSLNEDKGFDVVKSLVSAFNDSVSGDANIPLAAERPGSRVLTRSDGTRYRDHGNIRFYQGYIDPQDVAKWKATKPVEKFWDWLTSQPGVKPIGQVSGEFRQDPMRDAVAYKGQYFVLTPNGSVIWGSVSRFKNPRSVWRQQDSKQGVAEGSDDTIYPNAEVIKSKNGKPVGEIYQDGNYWGAFHYKADRGYDFIDSREEAIEALKDLHQETGRSRPNYTVKGVAEGSDGWIGNPAKWKEAVLQAHGPDVVFKNYSHPGQPGKRSVHAWDVNGKIVGVYQRHNKMGMVQPNMQGVAEAGYSGIDDTDTVGFSVNSERAYNAVMARFGDSIDHDETSGILYVPARMWPKVEMVAFDADGEGAVQADGSDELAESDDFRALLAFADGRQQSLRLANPANPVKQVLSYMIRRKDIDALKRLVSIDGINVKNIVSQLMAGRSNQVNLESRVASMNSTINSMLEAAEKIGGRHDPAEFDAMVSRVGQQAKQGPMKTVWDPVKRVYKVVPVNKK